MKKDQIYMVFFFFHDIIVSVIQMKRLMTLFTAIILIFTGCESKNSNYVDATDEQLTIYEQYINKITENTNDYYDYNKVFDLTLTFVKDEDHYNYTLILDNATIDMYHIILVAYSKYSLDSYQPTLGIFDDISYSLVQGLIDKDNGFYKGIGLSGSVSKKSDLIVILSYYNTNEDNNRFEYVMKVPYED